MQNQENKKCSAQCFCDGSCKKQNTLSTRHKSRNGEAHKEMSVEEKKESLKSFRTSLGNIKNQLSQSYPEKTEGSLEDLVFLMSAENLNQLNKRLAKIAAKESKTEEDSVFNKDSEIHNCNWTKCGEKECNHCYPIKEGVVQNDKRAEKETMKYLQGIKHNKEKPKLSLLFKQFPQALEAVAKCSEYGHKKYKESDYDYLNYQRVEGGSNTYADAGLRHRLEQGNDLESGLPHQYHVAWNALAELQLWINENKVK